MTENLIHLIKRHEGFRSHAYRDSLGFWTIGYGRLIDARRGGGISGDEAGMLLAHDLVHAETAVKAIFPTYQQFSKARYQALVSMAFNLGQDGLGRFARMRRAIKDNDWTGAAREALDSRWASQVPTRAQHIAALLTKGE